MKIDGQNEDNELNFSEATSSRFVIAKSIKRPNVF